MKRFRLLSVSIFHPENEVMPQFLQSNIPSAIEKQKPSPNFELQIDRNAFSLLHRILAFLRVGSHDPFFGSSYFSGIVLPPGNVDSHH